MTALVAGASSDIGRAIAAGLAADGHDLVLWGRDGIRLQRTGDEVRGAGRDARVQAFDLADRARLQEAVDAAGPLQVAVWAVGDFDFAPFDAADPSRVDQVLDRVLVTAAAAVRLLLPGLLRTAPSCLVLIGSGADRAAFPGNAAYVAAKHGLRGLADAVHLDVRDRGVRVTLVSPGPVAAGAGLTAPGAEAVRDRLLQPADVAHAVRFAVAFPGPGSVLHLDLEPGAALDP